MKRITFLALALLIIFSTMAFASAGEKLSNHWSKDYIELDFLAYYFPYLARDGFGKFNPESIIKSGDFSLSLASLSKDYNMDISIENFGLSKNLSRKEAVVFIGGKILEDDTLKYDKKDIPFLDINTMDKESIELLKVLYNLGIIYGVSEKKFDPDRELTQAEAVIILQRLKAVWEELKDVDFVLKGMVQSYSSQEDIIVKEEEDRVLVTITRQFPTPGYSMNVEKILRDKGQCRIYLNIDLPRADTDQAQVITYKTMTIEIEKEELTQGPPFIFTVEEIKSNLME
ncbi:MAG: S-layer homology domain-containing protein [Tissierellaceae bacterium]